MAVNAGGHNAPVLDKGGVFTAAAELRQSGLIKKKSKRLMAISPMVTVAVEAVRRVERRGIMRGREAQRANQFLPGTLSGGSPGNRRGWLRSIFTGGIS